MRAHKLRAVQAETTPHSHPSLGQPRQRTPPAPEHTPASPRPVPAPSPNGLLQMPNGRNEMAHSPMERHPPKSIPTDRSTPNVPCDTEPNPDPRADTIRCRTQATAASRRTHPDPQRLRHPAKRSAMKEPHQIDDLGDSSIDRIHRAPRPAVHPR